MTLASRKDKVRVMEILIRSFENDPLIRWFTSPCDRGKSRRIRSLMNFAFEKGFAQQGIYLTDDRNAVAIWKYGKTNMMTFRLFRAYLDFGLTMGLAKMMEIFKMEKQVNKRHPKVQHYLYLWFLGVMPNHQGKGLSSALLNPKLALADKNAEPIYLETNNEKNIKIYECRGFKLYDRCTLDSTTHTEIYFMRKLP